MAEIKTYIIEAKYDEASDAGGYAWIGRAYNDAQANRMCAMQMILDNEWESGDCARQYTSLKDAFEEELTVLHERGDFGGASCPNCSSTDARTAGVHGFGESAMDILKCGICNYQWVPLGPDPEAADEPTNEQIEADLAEFEAIMAMDPEEREEV